jgi:enamine deaminase RidA (YjgF/YER057c/UK114 family)
MEMLIGSNLITIFVCTIILYASYQLIKKLTTDIKSALELIEALTTDIVTLNSFMEKMHKTMHLIKSIDPLFHKYQAMNEALKTEDTIQNTHINIEEYYEELFKNDKQMTYLRGE